MGGLGRFPAASAISSYGTARKGGVASPVRAARTEAPSRTPNQWLHRLHQNLRSPGSPMPLIIGTGVRHTGHPMEGPTSRRVACRRISTISPPLLDARMFSSIGPSAQSQGVPRRFSSREPLTTMALLGHWISAKGRSRSRIGSGSRLNARTLVRECGRRRCFERSPGAGSPRCLRRSCRSSSRGATARRGARARSPRHPGSGSRLRSR